MKKQIHYQTLFNELQYYEDNGISLMLDGVKASPEEIVMAHVLRESSVYMRDYVTTKDQKHLIELHFDPISDP